MKLYLVKIAYNEWIGFHDQKEAMICFTALVNAYKVAQFWRTNTYYLDGNFEAQMTAMEVITKEEHDKLNEEQKEQ